LREAVTVNVNAARTAEHLRELRQILGLPKDADAATIEAAIQHAKAENQRRALSEVMGTPFSPQPFQGIPEENGPGLSPATMAKIDKIFTGGSEPTRAERIAALIEIHAKAREVAGKPPLSAAEAFEMAARELDGGKSQLETPGG
jgi:hypothetical protein